jgi:hypothetical protein
VASPVLIGLVGGLVVFAGMLSSATNEGAAGRQDTGATAPPVRLTAEQDHQRMMDLLHITSLRRGADGDPKSPNAANYDEEKAKLAEVAAGSVYRLLGKKDLGTSESPPMETSLIDGELAYRQHAGGHTPGPNWPSFLMFAGRYIKGPAASANL